MCVCTFTSYSLYINGVVGFQPFWFDHLFSDVTSEGTLDVTEDCLDLLQAVDLLDDALSVVSVNDWQLLSLVLSESLPKCLHVVVGAAGRG